MFGALRCLEQHFQIAMHVQRGCLKLGHLLVRVCLCMGRGLASQVCRGPAIAGCTAGHMHCMPAHMQQQLPLRAARAARWQWEQHSPPVLQSARAVQAGCCCGGWCFQHGQQLLVQHSMHCPSCQHQPSCCWRQLQVLYIPSYMAGCMQRHFWSMQLG